MTWKSLCRMTLCLLLTCGFAAVAQADTPDTPLVAQAGVTVEVHASMDVTAEDLAALVEAAASSSCNSFPLPPPPANCYCGSCCECYQCYSGGRRNFCSGA